MKKFVQVKNPKIKRWVKFNTSGKRWKIVSTSKTKYKGVPVHKKK